MNDIILRNYKKNMLYLKYKTLIVRYKNILKNERKTVMSKYENLNKKIENIDVRNVLVEGESIIWQGKPKKSAYIFNKILTMFPFALLWLLFDGFFIVTFLLSGTPKQMLWFIIPFFDSI